MKIGLVSPVHLPAAAAASPSTSATSTRTSACAATTSGSSPRSHGPQRASEGDIIRIGDRLLVPANGSVGTLTFSPRYIAQVRDAARARAVRRPPLPRAVRAVPVAVPAARVAERQRRHVPRLRRLLARRTSSAAGSCAATPRGSTAGSRSARPRATSSTATSRATTRSSPTASTSPRFAGAVPLARWQDGTPNILFVGRFEPRKGLLDLLKAYRILRKTGCDCRLLVVGSGPQEREARRYVATRGLPGRRVPGPRQRRREGPAVPDRRRLRRRRPPAASRSGSCCSRRWPPGAPIVASDIHGYKGVVRRGREGLLVPPREPKELADGDRPAARRPGPAGRDGRRRPRARRGVQLAAGHRQGRGLLRLRHPPARGRAARCPPTSARRSLRRRRVRARPSGVVRRPGASAPVGQRQPPDPGRVGDHQAGHDERDRAGPRASA